MKYVLYIILLFFNTSLIAKENISLKDFDLNQEVICLVETIYFEARGEDFVGQLGVGTVVMERVESKSFPNTVCDVVRAGRYWKGNPVRNKCAFSYWCDGKSERMYDYSSLEEALEISLMGLKGVRLSSITGATHYHAQYVKPYWSHEMKHIFTSGKHLFYKGKK